MTSVLLGLRRSETECVIAWSRNANPPLLLMGLLILVSGCLERVETQPPADAIRDPQNMDASAVAATAALPEVTTASGIVMLAVPAGEFQMGNAQGSADEQPRHTVTVSGFLMDKFEMTQDVFGRLELPNPAHFKGDRRPVEQVRWSDAALFCNERSRAEGLEPCYDEVTFACNFEATGYRLPTEAEWEYAATSGGRTSPAAIDASSAIQQLQRAACYTGNSSGQTQPVGNRRANGWGFCDLQGNVAEWCNDIYAADYYGSSPTADPRGPKEGAQRVLRGGSWKSDANDCRLSARLADDPGISDACFARDNFGFRCVRRAVDADEAD